jgi:hypothetical protein
MKRVWSSRIGGPIDQSWTNHRPPTRLLTEFSGNLGGPGRNRTDVQGFAVLCITTLPPGQWVAVPTHGAVRVQVEITPAPDFDLDYAINTPEVSLVPCPFLGHPRYSKCSRHGLGNKLNFSSNYLLKEFAPPRAGCYIRRTLKRWMSLLIPGSSAVEQEIVNLLVGGSNPSRGANKNRDLDITSRSLF